MTTRFRDRTLAGSAALLTLSGLAGVAAARDNPLLVVAMASGWGCLGVLAAFLYRDAATLRRWQAEAERLHALLPSPLFPEDGAPDGVERHRRTLGEASPLAGRQLDPGASPPRPDRPATETPRDAVAPLQAILRNA